MKNLTIKQLQVTVIKEIKTNVLMALYSFSQIFNHCSFGTPHADADAVGTHVIHSSPDYLPAFFLFLQTGFVRNMHLHIFQ